MTLDSKIFGNEDDSAREHRFEKRPTIPETDVQRAIEHVRRIVADLQTVDFLVKTASSSLSAEQVVTDTPSIAWDWATAGQAKADVQFASEAEHITGTNATKAANSAGIRAAMDEGIWEIGTIANAVTLNLGSVHNLRVLVQGNANPSSFGTTPNLIRFVEFDTASIIIHNATTLRCPGATNITTQAGSRYICTSDSSGNWTIWTGFHTNGAMQNVNAWQASWGSAYWARGSVTAAATTNLTTSNAPIQTVSGNTGISSFGSGANRCRILIFTGTPLITHSSALVCPGNVNLQVAAGAWAIVSSDGSSNWTIMFYQKADGVPLDAELAALASVTSAADKVPYFTGSGTAAVADFTSVARTLVGQTTQALMRTTGLGMSANGSSLVSATDYAAMRALLDLEAGTDFLSPAAIAAAYQPLDADLTAIAALSTQSFGRSLLTASDAAAALSTLTALGQGKSTIYIPAGAMITSTTSGAASASLESTTNDVNYKVFDFDASADEHVHFNIVMPKSWNEGTVTFKVVWSSTATDTDGVAWGLQAVAISDNEAIDATWGTAVVVTDDAQSAAGEIYVTAESAAVTIGGSPAEGDIIFFRLFRDVSDANDDMTEDARLIGIHLYWTSNAATDT